MMHDVPPSVTASPGQVITFYSYKGGTGRSMALANTAVLLAQRREQPHRTLMIDWDLEAPGLHKYFPLTEADGDMADPARPGLADLFSALFEGAQSLASLPELERRSQVIALIDSLDLDQYITRTDVADLDLLKAGRFDQHYSDLVNRFRWDELYEWAPWAFRALTERLIAQYRFVLVDSRTGLTDTSSICTALLPDKLVVVFTPNEQSLDGVRGLVERTIEHRYASDDLRPLIIYPLPSRIEESEPGERDAWRLGSADRKLFGWQRLFETTLENAYEVPRCNLSGYFDAVQIRHHPYYAYGEKIAVRLDRGTEVTALPRVYERFVDWLANRASPWESEAEAREREARALGRRVDDAYTALDAEGQALARQLFLRLVHILGDREVGEFSLRIVQLSDLTPLTSDVERVIAPFEQLGVLVVERTSPAATGQPIGIRSVQLREKALLSAWTRLREWIDQDRAFLVWRQRLDHQVEGWMDKRESSRLLRASSLDEAIGWWKSRPQDFNSLEREFIAESERERATPVETERGDRIEAAQIESALADARPQPFAVRAPTPVSAAPSWSAVASLSAAPSLSTVATAERIKAPSRGRRGLVAAAAALLLVIAIITVQSFTHSDKHATLVVTAAGLTADLAQSALLLASLDDKDESAALGRARTVASNRLPVAVYPMPGAIATASVNAQGTYIVATTTDGHAYLRTVQADGGHLLLLPADRAVRGSFSPDGRAVLIAGPAGALTVLARVSTTTDSLTWALGRVTATTLHADSSTIGAALLSDRSVLTVSRTGTMTNWTRSGCCTWAGSPSRVRIPEPSGIAFSANGATLAIDIAGRGGLQLRDTRALGGPIFVRAAGARLMALSRDGTSVSVVSHDSVAMAWDLIGITILERRTALATAIAIDARGDRVAVATAAGRTLVYPTQHGTANEQVRPGSATGDSIELRTTASVGALAFADSSILVTASDSTLRIWRVDQPLPSPTASWSELRKSFASTSGCLSASDRHTILGESESMARSAFGQCAERYGIVAVPLRVDSVVARAAPDSGKGISRGRSRPDTARHAVAPTMTAQTTPPRAADTAPAIDLTRLSSSENVWTGEWTRTDGSTSTISFALAFKGRNVFGTVRWGAGQGAKGDGYRGQAAGSGVVTGTLDVRRYEIQLHADKAVAGEPAEYRLLVVDPKLQLRGTILTADTVRSTVRASLSAPASAR